MRTDRPFDRWRSQRSVQRVALAVGQAEPTHEQAELRGFAEDGRWDRVELQLRSAKHREGVSIIDRAPREVDEPAAGPALDVGAREIDAGQSRSDVAVQGPRGRWCIAGDETEQFVSSISVLDADVDVPIPAGTVRAGSAGPPR